MRITTRGDLWWRTAIIYCIDIERYCDADDDGVGDLAGLVSRIEYLSRLGVTCLWLMPFYPSPRLDHGYDVADFYGVDSRFGHLGDLVEVIRTAHERGIRVITDLLVNHTSDEHPWFQAARSGPDDPHHDYYVWCDEPDSDEENMFPELEDGVWTYDEQAGRYYRHAFFGHQPDLNTDHPHVREELFKLVGFWLELGIDGFRVDAVDHAIDAGSHDGHSFLRALNDTVVRRRGTGALLGEVNLPHDEQLAFFGAEEGGDELTMQFDFASNQRLFLSLARNDARPLAQSLQQRPALTGGSQWANFVRNHDELTLNQLSESEAQEVLDAFAPHEYQRFHGRGMVRRLPGMLDHDPARIKMVYSLLFSLPGTPVLLYGEEIGLAENSELGGRKAVRPLMHWSDGANGGFSAAARHELVAAPENSTAPGAAEQLCDPDSLLNFVRTVAHHYRRSPEIGWGEPAVLPQNQAAVLAHTIRGEAGQTVALHHFGAAPTEVSIEIDDVGTEARLVDVFDGSSHPLPPDGAATISLQGYGYRWFHVLRAGEDRL